MNQSGHARTVSACDIHVFRSGLSLCDRCLYYFELVEDRIDVRTPCDNPKTAQAVLHDLETVLHLAHFFWRNLVEGRLDLVMGGV